MSIQPTNTRPQAFEFIIPENRQLNSMEDSIQTVEKNREFIFYNLGFSEKEKKYI